VSENKAQSILLDRTLATAELVRWCGSPSMATAPTRGLGIPARHGPEAVINRQATPCRTHSSAGRAYGPLSVQAIAPGLPQPEA
jgi:hypothetical protein